MEDWSWLRIWLSWPIVTGSEVGTWEGIDDAWSPIGQIDREKERGNDNDNDNCKDHSDDNDNDNDTFLQTGIDPDKHRFETTATNRECRDEEEEKTNEK